MITVHVGYTSFCMSVKMNLNESGTINHDTKKRKKEKGIKKKNRKTVKILCQVKEFTSFSKTLRL